MDPANYVAASDHQRVLARWGQGRLDREGQPADLALPSFLSIHLFMWPTFIYPTLDHLPGSVLGTKDSPMKDHPHGADVLEETHSVDKDLLRTNWEAGEH